MNDKLKSFAEIIKAANEERAARETLAAKQKLNDAQKTLGELFTMVSSAKTSVIAPKRDAVIEIVKNLEEQLETAVEATESGTDTQVPDDFEKRVMRVISQLQNDFKTLKVYVEQKPSGTSFAGGGSGEVQITRMDDVEGTPSNNTTLVWSESKGKFLFRPLPTSGTDEEEMIYSKRVDFVSDDLIYKGEAAVGSLEGDPVWRIRYVQIGADGDVSETWANGDASFSHEWTDRATYNYQ